MNGLHPRRIIHVRNRRKLRTFELELLDTEQLLLLVSQGNPQLLAHGRDDQHVGARRVLLEIVGDALPEDRRRERPERLAILDLEVHDRLHLRAARVTDDRAAAEGPWPKLHTALEPADHVLLGEQLRRLRKQCVVVQDPVLRAHRIELSLNLLGRISGPRYEPCMRSAAGLLLPFSLRGCLS